MVRIEVRLTPEQAQELKNRSLQEGVSVSELIRRAVAQILLDEDDQRWRRASALLGRYHGGPTDVSKRHDDYLAEDIRQRIDRTAEESENGL